MPRTRLAFDSAAVDHLRRSSRRMRALVDRVGPPTLRVEPLGDPYAALLRSIVYQQLTGKAAATILGRVCGLFGGDQIPRPEQVLAAPTEQLRSAGLSGAKTLAVQDLARRAAGGELPSFRSLARMDDETIIERLSEVRGVGRWSARAERLHGPGRQVAVSRARHRYQAAALRCGRQGSPWSCRARGVGSSGRSCSAA